MLLGRDLIMIEDDSRFAAWSDPLVANGGSLGMIWFGGPARRSPRLSAALGALALIAAGRCYRAVSSAAVASLAGQDA
jgi:hypothetical protein